jgi:hypothetical protein
VRGVQLDSVEARLHRVGRRAAVVLDDLVDLVLSQRTRRCRLAWGTDHRRPRRRPPRFRTEGLTPEVDELRNGDSTCGLNRLGAAGPALHDLGTPGLDQVATAKRRFLRECCPARDKHGGAALGETLPVLRVALNGKAVTRVAAGVGGGHETVTERGRTNLDRESKWTRDGAHSRLRRCHEAMLPT